MRALRLVLSAYLILLPFLTEPALAQVAPSAANVVSACGTPNSTYNVGTNKALTQDTTGTLCSEAGGGGGGGNVNLTGINGVTPLVGAGATASGSLRTTQAQDTTTVAGSAPGTAGTPSANVVSVQGVVGGTAQPISASALPLPTGAATSANQPTNAAQGSTTSGQTGNLGQAAVTTSNPSYTNGQTSPLNMDTAGNLRTNEKNSAAILSAVQGAIPGCGANPCTNNIGNVSYDPCSYATKQGAPISLTASGQVITGTSSKKTYICSIDIVSATAQNIALVEGTGTVCATNIFGLAGGTTAATGWNLAANGGLTKGSGGGTVYIGSGDANATAANVCLLLSSTGQTSGEITYVQQ